MALEAGTKLGPYEIGDRIGAGGMGEVYRARDTKLKRDVAVKVLPSDLASDSERLARFQREAEVLASLNHPNIAAIYGLEDAGDTKALIMELVEGPTLADHIAEGPIQVDEALPIAKQIAEALEAAHEQNVIHRDLKPQNVKVRSDGTVKVLDFGLAKAMEPAGAASPSMSQSPTITTPAMTAAGIILGTAAYMSPEQAKGRPVDKRTDIWAFGAVLYEMLTGKLAFEADDVSETLAAILRAEVDWSLLPNDLSPTIQTYLRRCLVKDPQERIRDIGDVRLAMGGAFETERPLAADTISPAARRASLSPVALAGLAAAVLLGLALGYAVWANRSAPQTPSLRRVPIALPETATFPNGQGTHVAISADGQTLIYRSFESGRSQIWQWPRDRLVPSVVEGTENAGGEPFVSPDGEWVVFDRDGTLLRASLSGGRPFEVAPMPFNARGGSWGADGTILLALRGDGLGRVPATGGEISTVAVPPDGQEFSYPQMLPGGQTALVTVSAGPAPDFGDLYLVELETGAVEMLLTNAIAGTYLQSGHLVFLRGGDLWATAFDLDASTVVGDPARVEPGIKLEGGGAVQFAVAQDGTMVYLSEDLGTSSLAQLVWVDESGTETSLDAPVRGYVSPQVSQDGTQVAVVIDGDIWVLDGPDRLDRLTEGGNNDTPLWLAEGQAVAYRSTGVGGGIFMQPSDRTGSAVRLLDVGARPYHETPKGEVLYHTVPGTDIGVVSVEGREGELLISTRASERQPALSPNGQWLAYASDESGQSEIYVRGYPDVGRFRRLVSTSGGVEPRWSPEGQTLYYLGFDDWLMAAAVVGDAPFAAQTPEPLIPVASYRIDLGGPVNYDVAPYGRFLFAQPETGSGGVSVPTSQLVLVENLFTELERLVPTN